MIKKSIIHIKKISLFINFCLFFSLLIPFTSYAQGDAAHPDVKQSPNDHSVLYEHIHNSQSVIAPADTLLKIKIEDIIDQVIKKAQSSLSKIQMHEKELLTLIERAKKSSAVGHYVALLSRARSAHQTMIQKEKQPVNRQLYEQAQCALLLKAATVIAEITHSQLLEILQLLDNYLFYWQDQKNHPIEYFFHKSPVKWVMGKNQGDEVKDNIRDLQLLQGRLYCMLGKLTTHAYNFKHEGTVTDHYEWIEQLLTILSVADVKKDKLQYKDQFDTVSARLQNSLSHMWQFKKNIVSYVSHTKKSNHFVRNWMMYTALLAGIVCAGQYWKNNSDVVNKWIGNEAIKGYIESGKNAFQQYFVNPFTGILQSIFKNNDSLKNKKENNFFNLVSAKNDYEISREDLKQFVEKNIEFGYITKDYGQKILNDEKHGSYAHLLKYIHSLSPDSRKALWNSGESIRSIIVMLSHMVFKIFHYIAFIEREISDLKVLASDSFNENNLTLKFTALIPLFGTIWGLSKIYSRYCKKDYSPIKTALAQVNSLFIESTTPLDDYNYGKLIYLLHKLKHKAIRYVSTKENIQQGFLHDITKLESKEFTVETKRLIIDNMRARYPFLSVA